MRPKSRRETFLWNRKWDLSWFKIQNLSLSTIVWRQCDIRINHGSFLSLFKFFGQKQLRNQNWNLDCYVVKNSGLFCVYTNGCGECLQYLACIALPQPPTQFWICCEQSSGEFERTHSLCLRSWLQELLPGKNANFSSALASELIIFQSFD